MKWVLAGSDDGSSATLAEQAGLHPLIARLMVIRGITGVPDAHAFLACDLSSVSEPGIFNQMEKAVGRIRAAIAGREKIVVYGDYDVDGVTGASLLFLVLKQLGAKVDCYIPDRITEGYGLNSRALERLRSAGTTLVISVDCGITAVQETRHARSIGLDLI